MFAGRGGFVQSHFRQERPREAYLTLQVVEFFRRQAANRWAGPVLACVALFVVLFALAGQTVNAPFVYYAPR